MGTQLRSALIVNRALGNEALLKFISVLNMLLIGAYACCCIADQMELEMWANAQRDGRPAKVHHIVGTSGGDIAA